jgi:hypothetical protein
VGTGAVMGKKKSPLVIDGQNRVYIDVKAAAIEMLCLLIDGVSIHKFPKDKRCFMLLDDAIEWHKKELDITKGKSGSVTTLGALMVIREKINDGKVNWVEL